jgi:hypothetical protein
MDPEGLITNKSCVPMTFGVILTHFQNLDSFGGNLDLVTVVFKEFLRSWKPTAQSAHYWGSYISLP